ncbi:MAG TPA: F0F1 ATP synthase subunit A [Rugosimonospora sp.]|nr:F0F1 ATP synthase subunit A [Rugosimonospora sp.]
MTGQATVLAASIPWPPSVNDFYLPSLTSGTYPWLTKFTLLVWLAVALIIVFFLVAYRNPKLVPGKAQWLAESIYNFGRDSVARDVIGVEGVRFAPYLTTLFCFVLVTNLFGIIPFLQISPNAHIAFPALLAFISWVLYLYLGVRKHGFLGYLKFVTIVPGVPWPMLLLVAPLEFLSTILLRPFTLSLRLFANMFAGHVVLLVFTLGGFVLANSSALFIKPISVVSWLMAILLTFFELLIAVLQAYVFALLTASYVQGALAEDH